MSGWDPRSFRSQSNTFGSIAKGADSNNRKMMNKTTGAGFSGRFSGGAGQKSLRTKSVAPVDGKAAISARQHQTNMSLNSPRQGGMHGRKISLQHPTNTSLNTGTSFMKKAAFETSSQ